MAYTTPITGTGAAQSVSISEHDAAINAAIGAAVSAEAGDRASALAAESSARAAAVAALEASIDDEAAARAAAISAETTARQSADNLGDIIRLSSVTGTANAATGTVQAAQAHIAITGRQRIQSLWPTTNTATNPTLTIGATAYTIKRRNGSALAAGDLIGGAVYDFVLDPDAVNTLRLMDAVAVGDITGLRGDLDALAATAGGDAARPGTQIAAFGAGSAGAPSTLGDLTAQAGVSVAPVAGLGEVLIVEDTALIVAPRTAHAVQPGRVYRLHTYVKRLVDPADPAGDTVRVALRRLDADYAAMATMVVDDRALMVADGLRHVSATFALDPGLAGVDHLLPADTVYVRPQVQFYGTDHRTAVVQIEIVDITEAAQIDGALDVLTIEQAVADAEAAADRAETMVVDAAQVSADRAIAEAAAANAQSSALTCATWAVLSGLTGATAGTGAEVLDADTGTHTDPVVGGTVPNAGRYSWSASPAGWQRIGATGLSEKASVLDLASEVAARRGAGFSDVAYPYKGGSGSAWLMRDPAGNLRVIRMTTASGEVLQYGRIVSGHQINLIGAADPEAVEAYRDVNGKLRVAKVVDPARGGAVIYGASSTGDASQSLPQEFVIFLTAGQSNMAGIGKASLSVSVPAGVMYQYYSGALSGVLSDPVGNADTGSSLPAFAREFYRRTGMGVIFVPCASGGAGLTAAASQVEVGGTGLHWSSTGTLRAAAVAAVNAAKAAATAAGFAWRFGGVLWSQGERDARCLPSAGDIITEADYLSEFDLLLEYFRAQFGGSKWPLILSQTGGDLLGIDAEGLSDMRDIQREIVQTRAGVYFGWTGAFNLISRGLMRNYDFPSDPDDTNRSHYSQQGYNEMGAAMAVVAASIAIGVA